MKKITLLATMFFGIITSNAQCVSTLAGSGVSGYADGIGTVSQFYFPTGVATDASGNVYLADSYNHRIRKITPSGVVTTLAGSGSAGFINGTGVESKFKYPYGVAVDLSGNVYVADGYNHRIRKITPSGVVTTLAGSGIAGYSDGAGTSAEFNVPHGVAVDALGNVYVADVVNNRIRKITPAGMVTTLAGSRVQGFTDGIGIGAQFSGPTGVATDALGNVYVADHNNNRIRKITPTGIVTTLAGSEASGFADGIGILAQFSGPDGVAVDSSGNVYVADSGNNRIRKITPLGLVTTLAGSGAYGFSDGTGVTAVFYFPKSIAIDASGNAYVGDQSNHRIRKIIPSSISANINYTNSTFCKSLDIDQTATLSGTGAYTGGTFSSTTGLSISSTNGAIRPNTSTAGTYTVTYTVPDIGCAFATTTKVTILADPTASISADWTIATNTSINNGNSVQLQLNGFLNEIPNIQWTPATSISSTSVSNPVVYPNTTTTYTASFINSNGCQQSTSFVVNVNPQPTIGTLSLTSPSSDAIGLFDTITVDVQLTGATNIYSLFMKLKGNAAVNQYLDYQGFTASTLLGSGSSVISTPPTVSYGVADFGITKVGTSSGYSGSGLYYTLRFVPKNISIPDGTVFCFYIDDVIAYNSSGTPSGLNNQGQICYTFTNQVNVWPGDLNNTKTVTTADLLPIGYFYNSTGPTRTNTSIQWNPQLVTLWAYNHSSQNGDAYKVFADSNGDGVINNADQAAIGFNMSQVHARQINIKPFSIAPNTQSNTLTVGGLIVKPNATIINAATFPQSVTFTVNLNNTGGLNTLYGISVNLIFDNTVFDLNTATIDYAGSIFGTAGADCLVMNYNSASGISVGLTRYANAAINGQGVLFKVTLQTKSPLGSSLTQTPVTAYIDSANNQTGDTLVIQDAQVSNFTIINNLGIDTIKQDEFILYPNPTNDILYLSIGKSINQLENFKLIVFNTLGQIVNEMPVKNSNMQISTRNWGAAGMYFVQITNSTNTVLTTKKVLLVRK
jgi:hypothetical protein